MVGCSTHGWVISCRVERNRSVLRVSATFAFETLRSESRGSRSDPWSYEGPHLGNTFFFAELLIVVLKPRHQFTCPVYPTMPCVKGKTHVPGVFYFILFFEWYPTSESRGSRIDPWS